MNLDTLRQLVGLVDAAAAADRTAGLPPHELRFVLEYAAPPDLQQEARRLANSFPPQTFILQPLSRQPATANFLILRFPGFERVFRPAELFELGYQLCDALELVSAEPDLGSNVYIEPATSAGPGREEAFVRAICQVADDPPADTAWALSMVGAQAAWSISTGEGIRIGHADTGYTQHAELSGALDLDAAIDLIDGSGSAVDPLAPQAANPGHGTGTGSVIASRPAGLMTGVAPAAKLVPIRCIDDVKVFNQSPVAAAIAYAQEQGCQVISMSLGGVPSRALYAAVSAAVQGNVIVVAAAGNCVTTVVWPARYDEVIAVAGCNYKELPWKGSCQGPTVDITAPGEHVWCAAASADPAAQDGIKAGQGTSYAVAMVAGAAALWLGAHGHGEVVAEAARRGCTVQVLFRAALQASARRPHAWDTGQFGRGILDVEALVKLCLEQIPLPVPGEAVPGAEHSLQRMLVNDKEPLTVPRDFDWRRYASELGAIALQAAQQETPLSDLSRESKTFSTFPSPQLARAVDAANAAALRQFGIAPNAGIVIVRRAPAPAPAVTASQLRHALAMVPGSHLETSAKGFDPYAARDYLKTGGIQQQIDHLDKKLQRMPLSAYARGRTVEAAEQALSNVVKDGSLNPVAQFGLESLIALTGRPALRTANGKIDLNDPRAEDWHDRLYQPVLNWRLNEKLGSVGRIDLDGRHIGTGFVIAPGRILTNRHVLQGIGIPVPTRSGQVSWRFEIGEPSIDFADDPSTGRNEKRFIIRSVIASGDQYIDPDSANFSLLDAAILEVEAVNVAGTALPPQLPMRLSPDIPVKFSEIVTIGYPARLGKMPRIDGAIDNIGIARLDEIYQDYDVRYLAPGEITTARDKTPGSRNFWAMGHDATTLGGCSGACLLQLAPGTGAVGLHFAGVWRTENAGHAIGAVKANHPLFNGVGGIEWVA
jgi:serine protease